MFETKKTFFKYLKEGRSLDDFKKASANIWENVDHSFMEEKIKQLEEMISASDLEGKMILNPNAEFEEIFELTKLSRFREIESLEKRRVDSLYKTSKKTFDKEFIDGDTYLANLVEKYDLSEKIVPYFNKDGTVRSYHTVASYNSMLYNTNLNRAGWNRTMYDANLLNKDLLYLPAHPYACDMCRPFQGKVYSKNGKSLGYPLQAEAIAGGVGHPNCKHQWLIYWNEEQLQKNTYTSEEWGEKYDTKQKIQALELKRDKLAVDRDIYESLGDGEGADKITTKIKAINSEIKELNKTNGN